MRYVALPKEPAARADESLTVAEVGLLLNLAEKTVYTMAQKAVLPRFSSHHLVVGGGTSGGGAFQAIQPKPSA